MLKRIANLLWWLDYQVRPPKAQPGLIPARITIVTADLGVERVRLRRPA